MVVILDETLASHDNSPAEDDDTDPKARAHYLEHYVTWYFEYGIGEEENGERNVVLL